MTKVTVHRDVLRRIIDDLADEVSANVLDEARRNAPVDTGLLSRSGSRTRIVDGYEIRFSTPYAAYVEFGTSRQRAQPFLGPALQRAFTGLR